MNARCSREEPLSSALSGLPHEPVAREPSTRFRSSRDGFIGPFNGLGREQPPKAVCATAVLGGTHYPSPGRCHREAGYWTTEPLSDPSDPNDSNSGALLEAFELLRIHTADLSRNLHPSQVAL